MKTWTRVLAILLIFMGLVGIGFLSVGYVPMYRFGNLGSQVYDFRPAVQGMLGLFQTFDGIASSVVQGAGITAEPKILYIFTYRLAQEPNSDERAYIILWGYKSEGMNQFGLPTRAYCLYAYKDFSTNRQDANSLQNKIENGYTYLSGGSKYKFANPVQAHLTGSIIYSGYEEQIVYVSSLSERYEFVLSESGEFDINNFSDLGLTLINANY